jgi:hypothetical protein
MFWRKDFLRCAFSKEIRFKKGFSPASHKSMCFPENDPARDAGEGGRTYYWSILHKPSLLPFPLIFVIGLWGPWGASAFFDIANQGLP